MKLKFRAEKKDVIAFLWGCLLLLIVVALIVVNAYHVTTGDLYVEDTTRTFTINFIKGFFPPYLPYTIIFWIVAIIVLLASVSSYFFEREKGFGFKEGKNEKGFGRFAKEDEYKRDANVVSVQIDGKEATGGGFPLLYDKKKNLIYVDNGEYHSLVIGATGSGKTQTVIYPQVSTLAKNGESMVITDPKGEIYDKCAGMLQSLGYKIIVVNFRDPQNGSCWNPYALPYKYYKEGNQDKANELLNDMAINIATDEKADDPFWTNSAADYLTGLSLGMFEDASEDEISISTVNLMMTVGDEKIGGSTYLKEYFKMKDPASPAAINALGTVNAPQDTKNSIDSVLKQKIKVFAVTKNLSEMLSRSDFDMEKIGEEKTAVFMIIQDEKTTYHALATIFIKQCYESLISVATRHGGKLPVRTNFLIDEFANMPKFKDITTMVTAARSRQIRFTFIIQNFAQLSSTYGKEDAETIRGNCGNLLYLLTGELAAMEEISKLCGDKVIKVGKDKREETRPLITVTELQKFKQFEVLVLRQRLCPLRTNFIPFFKTDYGYGKGNSEAPKLEMPTHEQRPIKLFDIREYVKNKKNDEKNNLFGSSNPFGASASPFGSGMSNNPFGGGSPFGNSNPFSNQTSVNQSPFNNIQNNPFESNKSNDEELDIDEMIKKIDARIAELEAEEENDNKEKDNIELASERKDEGLLISPGKIDFSSFNIKKDHDIMDDFMEDLSEEEDIKEDVKEEFISKDTVINTVNKESNLYKNKEEIDKIMNEEDSSDDDIFDDFFE